MEALLGNIRVLDISRILSGPFCTMLLADLGATVVKVENPVHGDMARRIGPTYGLEAAYFMSVNRGKLGITLDIFHPKGQELLRELVTHADVLVENYTPGTMRSLGLDYPALKAINPKLIYASVSGFGQSGPYAERPALDIIVQAMGGIMSITGEQGGPPLRPGVSQGDSIAGIFAAFAIVSTLYSRSQTGIGQHIDISMLDCQITLLENAIGRYFATGRTPEALGSRHPTATPFQSFPTADGQIVVALLTDNAETWERFCDCLGLESLRDNPDYMTNNGRNEQHRYLENILSDVFQSEHTAYWIKRLQNAHIPCAPVNTIPQAVNDPQVVHRNMIVDIPHPEIGTWKVANTPFKFSDAVSGPQGVAPGLGQNTSEIFREWLGLSDEEIAELRTKGIA